MKEKLKLWSLICFILGPISLLIVDCCYYGYGLLSLFLFIGLGLGLDQVRRIVYPDFNPSPKGNFKKNKLIHMISLLIFVESPMFLIYGNRFKVNFGLFLFFALNLLGLSLNHKARVKYPYS